MSVSVFAVLLLLTGTVDFGVDWAAFRAGGDSSRVEFFYAIPHDQLRYAVTDSGIASEFTVHMEMTGRDNGFKQEGTIYKRARIASFEEARRVQRSFVDGFSITAPAGRYRFKVTVAESLPDGTNAGLVEDSLVLAGFGQRLAISSLQLGANVITDTVTGAVSVVPNPSRRFNPDGTDAVYVYYEGYNFRPDTGQYQVRVAVLSRAGGKVDTLVSSEPMVKPKVGTSVVSALGVSVDGVKPGEYSLAVELADLAAGQSVVGERPFRIGSADAGQPGKFVKLDNLTEREQRYSREIQHLATPRELAYYKALSDSGKEAYLAWFWSRHNLTEFSRRMEAAQARFYTQKTSGVKTDRGRVYVKYGEPDAIEQKVIETDIRPREYWHYYTNGYVFVFIDIRGDGNFRLAWTKAKEEPPTGFEGYLSEEEQEQFK